MEAPTVEYGDSASASNLFSIPQFLHRRNPDVPTDIEDNHFDPLEHLNDPNFDIKAAMAGNSMPSRESIELGDKHKRFSEDYTTPTASIYDKTDAENSSMRYSTAESRSDAPFPDGLAFDDESPYPEVRAAVSSVDDPLMPVNTFRMWFLGILYSIVISGLNQFFSMRYPSVIITGIVCQLTALPLGRALEKILPTTRFRTFGYTWSLNPGPFTIKEHVCITVMANVVYSGAYATDIIATQKAFYDQQVSFAYQILLVLGTQMIGFSFSGFLRQYIVWPASMIWPGALVSSALFNTLHKNYGRRERSHISRERFFLIAMACSFFWYFIPGYLFTALSVFNWACWIAPNNIVVNTLFGTNTGLGMGILTFDWSMIAYVGSPLVTPWWSEANTGVAMIFFFWILAPILYFTNTWNFAYLPASTYEAFDNTGAVYDPTQIVTNGVFDVEKYRAYSPVFVSTTLAIAYGLAFAAFSAVVVHTFLWFRHDIARRFNSSLRDERDIHSRLMVAYPEVPRWWYAILGLGAFVMLVIAIEIFPTGMPVWAAILAIITAFVLSLPLGMLQAITNQTIALEVMHEMVAGYIMPGHPIANMIYKAVAYIGASQAVSFSGDLKLGHYMKIPPRMMFACQCVAAVVSCFVVTGVQDWMFANIPDFCTETQVDGFICPSTNTFATASLIWGGVGPRRLFTPGSMYSPLLWFFLIGALLPIPFYFLARRYPLSFFRYVNIPVFFAGVGALPPASVINYSSWLIVGFIFNWFMRRCHFRWWMRYNYILSAALDSGLAISMIVIFFALQMPKGGVNVSWWGNDFWMTTADANGIPLKSLSASQPTFGPSTWS